MTNDLPQIDKRELGMVAAVLLWNHESCGFQFRPVGLSWRNNSALRVSFGCSFVPHLKQYLKHLTFGGCHLWSLVLYFGNHPQRQTFAANYYLLWSLTLYCSSQRNNVLTLTIANITLEIFLKSHFKLEDIFGDVLIIAMKWIFANILKFTKIWWQCECWKWCGEFKDGMWIIFAQNLQGVGLLA